VIKKKKYEPKTESQTDKEIREKKVSVDDDDDDTEPIVNEDEATKLAVLALLEVVESGSKNIELAIMRNGTGIQFLPNEKVIEIVKQIEEEKEKAGKGKKKKGTGDKDKDSSNVILSRAAREANK